MQKAISARLDQREILGSQAQLDCPYRRVGFNDNALFGLRRKDIAEHKDIAHFVMLRASSDYKGMKNAIEYLLIGQKAFFTDQEQSFTILKAP